MNLWTKYKKWFLFFGALLLAFILFNLYKYYKQSQYENLAEIQKTKAEKIFKPVIDIFDQNIDYNSKNDSTYDIDKTIRVIHEIDQAITKNDNLEDYLLQVSKQDYRNVAPEVLKARKELMKTIMEIYSRQTKLEDQPDYWDMIREYTLAAGSGINPEGLTSAMPLDGIKYDPEMTKKTYQKYLENKEVSQELKDEIRGYKNKLLGQLYDYSSVYYKYYDQWDRICLHRDKAYLASRSGQWDVVQSEAENAIKKAPYDKEAHVLKGLALVASMPSANMPNIQIGESNATTQDALPFLDQFIDANPNYSAPALLLKGVYYQKKGDMKNAKLMFEESAAYFPKQADILQNNFDPYKMRAYLRKSKEGNLITESYKTTMLGGGYFTPDLQLAKLYYNSNNPEMGRNKVLDHFSRRRNQSQWDYIISDIQFCENAFGAEFNKILPENNFLQLKVSPTMIGNKLNLSVVNNSDKRLNNASLILCVQFTDMLRDDYISIKVDKTLPAILPHESNDFGTQEILEKIFGKEKGVDDIVLVRAIVISDEAVNWVDTDEFKFEKIKKDRAKLTKEDAVKMTEEIGISKEGIIKLLKEHAKISISSSKLSINDQININLPSQLAFLSPLFRLSNDGKILIEPDQNELRQDGINLNFKLNKFTNSNQKTYTTKMFTKFGEFDITWVKDPKTGLFKIQDVKLI